MTALIETLLPPFFLAGSSLFFFLAAAAMLRLPDVYTRLNVLTKALTLAMAGVAGSLLAVTPNLLQVGKIAAVWLLVYYTGLLARRRIVRAAAQRSIPPWEL